MGHTTAELEAAAKRRAETSDRLVDSDADARLIVAGPGTGKTYNFRRALKSAGEGGLALTFIRALADELARDLADVAQVNTFNGFCKHLAYKLPLAGLEKALNYYPPLFILFAEDVRLLGDGQIGVRDLERALHTLDDERGLISRIMELGSYYNAVSHADVVYRVLTHLEGNPDAVPGFPLVVVDEYQDFCLMETRLIAALKTASPVLAAGDDDQALYGFKDASPEFIRALAEDDEFERFDLPYCSRCTEVVVDTVNNVVGEAQRRGQLEGRIDRDYLCYLPKKLEDSEAHPAIIHAECSVQTKKAPYMGRYVTEQIGRISDQDIAESHKGRYPTALVIGRRHFVEPVYKAIRESYPNAILRTSDRLEIDAVDGYRRLAGDARSRLGWRILVHTTPLPNADEAIATALMEQRELSELLPDDYRDRHLGIAELFRRLLYDGGITDDEIAEVEEGLERPFSEIEAALGRDEEGEAHQGIEAEDGVPSIICTSLLGAKGLSAGYVFIVGFNDGVFPADPDAISDDEICKLIVGLSRTRKECHLVSCGFWGTGFLKPSSFLRWLDVPIETRTVTKTYWS